MGRPVVALSLVLGFAAACGGDDGPAGESLVAVDDEVTIDEDAPILVDVLANDSDAEGRPLTLRRASAEGRDVSVEDGRVRVPTEPNWSGTIDVMYTVVAGTDSARGHAIITVAPVNDAPTARSGTALTGRNHPRPILLQGDDIESDPLTFEIESGPAHGTISGTSPAITYTPADGYIGEDAITFHARDAALSSAAATIAITVTNGTNPVATAQSVTTLEETPRAITLAGTDADNDPLTFAIATQPQHGTLNGTPPTVTYTPAVDYVGQDSFAFTANDGVLTSDPAIVTVNVTNVNDPPVAQVQMIAATEDTPVAITLVGTDTEGGTLTYTIVDAPAHGVLGGTGAARTYTPAANFHGADSFTFTVSDGMATSAPATVSFVVASVEDAPVAIAQMIPATEDTPRQITLTGSDGDGDPLTFFVNGGTFHGDLDNFAGPTLTYTPGLNYNGPATITFTANDGDETSPAATIAITVAAVDDAPFIPPATITVAEDELATIPLPATDVDGEALTYTVTTPPSHGTISGTGAARQYRSAANFNGLDSFTLTASDGHSTSAPRSFAVDVTSVDDAPIARDDVGVAAPGQAVELDVLANDEEVDNLEFLTITSVSSPNNGTATTDGEVVIYQPTLGDMSQATFTYTVVDPTGLTATATVTVGIGQFPTGRPLRYVAHGPQSNSPSTLILPHDVSGDGRYVAFITTSPLDVLDTNQSYDVYVWDAVEGDYERISVPSGGGAGNGTSNRPSISVDGRFVAFQSSASNLVAGDTNGEFDIFVRDRVAGTTTRVSVSSTGAQASGMSTVPKISADGTVVSFQSTAFNLIPSDANGVADVFVRDLTAGTTTRVSVRTGGGEGDAYSGNPVLSGDGHVVAFVSSATNLITGDTNSQQDIFVHDRTTGITERASVSSTGIQATGSSNYPTISYSGRFIAFRTNAPNLVPMSHSTLGATVVRDREAQTTLNALPDVFATALSISADGRYLTGHNESGVCFVRDRFAATTHYYSSTAGALYYPVISPNGRYVAVLSNNALVPNVASGTKLFIYPNPL